MDNIWRKWCETYWSIAISKNSAIHNLVFSRENIKILTKVNQLLMISHTTNVLFNIIIPFYFREFASNFNCLVKPKAKKDYFKYRNTIHIVLTINCDWHIINIWVNSWFSLYYKHSHFLCYIQNTHDHLN